MKSYNNDIYICIFLGLYNLFIGPYWKTIIEIYDIPLIINNYRLENIATFIYILFFVMTRKYNIHLYIITLPIIFSFIAIIHHIQKINNY